MIIYLCILIPAAFPCPLIWRNKWTRGSVGLDSFVIKTAKNSPKRVLNSTLLSNFWTGNECCILVPLCTVFAIASEINTIRRKMLKYNTFITTGMKQFKFQTTTWNWWISNKIDGKDILFLVHQLLFLFLLIASVSRNGDGRRHFFDNVIP